MGQLNTDKQSSNSIVYTETDNAWFLVRKEKLGYWQSCTTKSDINYSVFFIHYLVLTK